jgi:hypothetical protein
MKRGGLEYLIVGSAALLFTIPALNAEKFPKIITIQEVMDSIYYSEITSVKKPIVLPQKEILASSAEYVKVDSTLKAYREQSKMTKFSVYIFPIDYSPDGKMATGVYIRAGYLDLENKCVELFVSIIGLENKLCDYNWNIWAIYPVVMLRPKDVDVWVDWDEMMVKQMRGDKLVRMNTENMILTGVSKTEEEKAEKTMGATSEILGFTKAALERGAKTVNSLTEGVMLEEIQRDHGLEFPNSPVVEQMSVPLQWSYLDLNSVLARKTTFQYRCNGDPKETPYALHVTVYAARTVPGLGVLNDRLIRVADGTLGLVVK